MKFHKSVFSPIGWQKLTTVANEPGFPGYRPTYVEPVFELPRGWGGWTPNCFLNPLTHCQIMFWGVSYILCT